MVRLNNLKIPQNDKVKTDLKTKKKKKIVANQRLGWMEELVDKHFQVSPKMFGKTFRALKHACVVSTAL